VRTMYDAVNAANIPLDAQLVAGYIDKIKLEPWSTRDWARFPNARKVTIVKKASTRDGVVLDVETYDASPTEAPGWVAQRRHDGFAHPVVYMNLSTWGAVRAAFRSAGVAEPLYWVAEYNGDPTWGAGWAVSGVIAKQYRGNVAPGIDISSVADYWPGVDPTPGDWIDMATQQEVEDSFFKALERFVESDEVRWEGSNWADCILQTRNSVVGLQQQTDATNEKLDELIAAVKALKP
jgi:hypothetical protein